MEISEIVIEKMKEIISFREMYELCLSKKGTCEGCPYWKARQCTKKSTKDVLFQAADVFEEFLSD